MPLSISKYVAGTYFIIKTNHRALKCLFSNCHRSRHFLALGHGDQEFDFSVKYVGRENMLAADALSRLAIFEANDSTTCAAVCKSSLSALESSHLGTAHGSARATYYF